MPITVNITISNEEVTKRVRNNTHKLAKTSGLKDPRIESSLQADETLQDTKIVDDAIETAVGNVVNAMSKYVSDTNYGGGLSVITLLMPDTWRSHNGVGLLEDVYDYVTDYTMSEFLKKAGNAKDASAFRTSADTSLSNAITKLLDRKSPLS